MRRSARPIIEPDPCDTVERADISARIAGFAAGMLSGSITTTGAKPPPRLRVTANGRAIGTASITWTTPEAEGTWRFDARDLPPHLLLDDRISLAITLPGRATPLDTIDVEPWQFPGLPARSRGRPALEGYVDGTEDDIVRGWVRDPTDAARRIKLMLFVDERFCGTYVADHSRPDLEATGRGDGRYGFTIPARAFLALSASDKPDLRVVSDEPHLWEVPPAPHLQARRRHFALPRLREVPQTTRELVAVLAGTEPFPKKIFLIDRATRRMPDAFSADYALLAIEYLRIEMLRAPACEPASWRERIVAWGRQRMIRGQIRRLSALAEAAAANRTLLDAAPGPSTTPSRAPS